MTRSHVTTMTSSTTEGPAALRLPSSWVRWMLTEAQARGQAMQAAMRDEDGSCQPCSTEAAFTQFSDRSWRVTQRHGCRSPRTRLEAVRDGVVVAAIWEDLAIGCAEGDEWRALVLEALVLAARSRANT